MHFWYIYQKSFTRQSLQYYHSIRTYMVHLCPSWADKTDTGNRNRPLSPCRPRSAVRRTGRAASDYTAGTGWSSHPHGTCGDTQDSRSCCDRARTGCSCSASYSRTPGWWYHNSRTSHTCVRSQMHGQAYISTHLYTKNGQEQYIFEIEKCIVVL